MIWPLSGSRPYLEFGSFSSSMKTTRWPLFSLENWPVSFWLTAFMLSCSFCFKISPSSNSLHTQYPSTIWFPKWSSLCSLQVLLKNRSGGKLWQFLKKVNFQLPYDLEISLLDIYPKELKAGTQTNICYISVHKTLVYQEVEVPQISIKYMNEWKKKCNV